MLEPVLWRILIKPDPVETKTSSGLIIAKDVKREEAATERGTVAAIGSTAFKAYDSDPPFKVGDRVYFAKYAGKIVEDVEENEKYILLNDEDIVAVIK